MHWDINRSLLALVFATIFLLSCTEFDEKKSSEPKYTASITTVETPYGREFKRSFAEPCDRHFVLRSELERILNFANEVPEIAAYDYVHVTRCVFSGEIDFEEQAYSFTFYPSRTNGFILLHDNKLKLERFFVCCDCDIFSDRKNVITFTGKPRSEIVEKYLGTEQSCMAK